MPPFPESTAPLIVVSNRLPYSISRRPGGPPPKRNVGGLVTALEPVLVERGGIWIGWDGAALQSAAEVAEALSRPIEHRPHPGLLLRGVPLSEREVALYYHGFANRALWPLFHDFPSRAVFAPEDFRAYQRVNRLFAEQVLSMAGPAARIWVHDFHLMLVPRILRELGFRGRIDFFLHIPFPPPEIFRALPWRKEILRGVLSSDTVTFHVPLYRDNFVRCAREVVGADVVEGRPAESPRILAEGREATARAIPIGIPVDEFENLSRQGRVIAAARRLKRAHGERRILFSADRLDYTKGLRERLHFLERYLIQHPESLGNVVLVQVVVPSRHQVEEYRVMKREFDREVGRINGEFGREGWMPIHYRYRALPREDLVAHYLAADVALVTPLRDGLNLVAAEFAACRTDEDGTLVVSEFAGIAEHSPGAILVNPYDVEKCSAAIARALGMPAAERRDRMRSLRQHVRSNPASLWARRCLELENGGESQGDGAGWTVEAAEVRP
jgi:trehalose 6-phosphate synthase